MEDLVGLGAAAVSGGTFGVLGAALGRVLGYFERREDHAQERARWAHERELHDLNMRAQAAETERELAVIAAEGSYEGLRESLRAESSHSESYKWVEAVRALVRPVLTPLLWVLYLVVFFAVMNGNAERYLAPEAAGDLVGYFISNVAFAATAATLWWFGDRAPRPRGLDG